MSYKNIGKILCLIFLGLFLFTGCGKEKMEYTITAQGSLSEAGSIEFLDYSIVVYQDPASNSCGDCIDQPVHLYVGADSGEVLEAMEEAIERADDLWEVEKLEGDTLVLREKEAGSVETISGLLAPAGLTLTGEITRGSGKVVVSGQTATENSVEYPENPQRLAAIYGPSYELLTMLGVEDKIVVRSDVQTDDFPWAEKVFSKISQIPALNNVHTSVNFEELMKYQPDLVYTFPRQNELKQLESAGIAALPGETGSTLEDVKAQVRKYGDTLGENAQEKAENYCSYFDEKLEWVKARTKDIPSNERPAVYYAGVDILTTYGKYSDLTEVIEAAGGTSVSAQLDAGNRTQIDYEQLMDWNPEIIFIDHGGMNDGKTVEEIQEELLEDSVYQSLDAVKNQKIYLCPSGVFYWDMGIQKILLVMHMAKILHPQLFADLDMEQEVMDFYEEFYGYQLTRDDAARIMNREDPR